MTLTDEGVLTHNRTKHAKNISDSQKKSLYIAKTAFLQYFCRLDNERLREGAYNTTRKNNIRYESL